MLISIENKTQKINLKTLIKAIKGMKEKYKFIMEEMIDVDDMIVLNFRFGDDIKTWVIYDYKPMEKENISGLADRVDVLL